MTAVRKLKYFLPAWLSFILLPAFAQIQIDYTAPEKNGTPDKLAMLYYEKKDYEKAIVYLEPLYDKNPEAWYIYYYNSLVQVKDFSRAEKITKKQIRQNKNNVRLYVYLGKLYKLQNDTKKEKEAYEKALKELSPYPPFVNQLGEAFTENSLYDQAIQTYNKGRKATPDNPYFYERAEVYRLNNNTAAMINEYLDALEFRETEIQNVQIKLQNSLGYDEESGGMKNPLLKQELQKRILNSPDKIILTEFLIFIQKLQGDFDGAFVQSRALDKRLKEEGQRIYELGRICVSNGRYETAQRCFSYLMEKGSENVYYDLATAEALNAEYMALTKSQSPAKQEFEALEQKLEKTYQKYGYKDWSAGLLKNLVNLKAYYLGKTSDAVTLIEAFLKLGGINNVVKAEYKILLADIYLLRGEIWDASLLYSQVEKDFKYEAIGQEAKFRNAKLSFYAGDFAWAKAQADILKGATSKLTSNDAIELSLVISDAIGVDTNSAPLSMFAGAELAILQHKYESALGTFDLINSQFSNHTLGDDIFYKKAQIFAELGKWADAETMYKNILEYYPDEIYGDDAQFKLAELYHYKLRDKEKAQQAYQDVLLKYPGSIYTSESRKRFRELRGDNINN